MEDCGLFPFGTHVVGIILTSLDGFELAGTIQSCKYIYTCCNGPRAWGEEDCLKNMYRHERMGLDKTWLPATGDVLEGDSILVPFSSIGYGRMGEPTRLILPRAFDRLFKYVPACLWALRKFQYDMSSSTDGAGMLRSRTACHENPMCKQEDPKSIGFLPLTMLDMVPPPKDVFLKHAEWGRDLSIGFISGAESVSVGGLTDAEWDYSTTYEELQEFDPDIVLPASITRVNMQATRCYGWAEAVCRSDNVVHLSASPDEPQLRRLVDCKLPFLRTLHLALAGDEEILMEAFKAYAEHKGSMMMEDLHLDLEVSGIYESSLNDMFACMPKLQCLSLIATVHLDEASWKALYGLNGLRMLHLVSEQSITMPAIDEDRDLRNLESLVIEVPDIYVCEDSNGHNVESVAHNLARLPSLRRVAIPFGKCDPVEVIRLLQNVNAIVFNGLFPDDIINPPHPQDTHTFHAPNLECVYFPLVHQCEALSAVERRLSIPRGCLFDDSNSPKCQHLIRQITQTWTPESSLERRRVY